MPVCARSVARDRDRENIAQPRRAATSRAAHRSSSAVPTDLNSVTASRSARPACVPAHSSASSARTCSRRDRAVLDRLHEVARLLERARVGVDEDLGARDEVVVALAHLARERADEVDVRAAANLRAADDRLARSRRAA